MLAKSLIPLLLIALSAPLTASAQVAADSGLVHLTSTAKEVVSNDFLDVAIYYESEHADSKRLMEQVNGKALEARKITAGFEGLTVTTTGFHTYPLYADQKITGWRARVEMSVTGPIDGSITKAVAALQDVFVVGGLTPKVSPERLDVKRKQLSLAAVAKFRAEASEYATAFGAAGWTLHEARVDSQGGYRPMPMPRAMKASIESVAMAAPLAVEAGETTLEVSVSGSIQLNPAQPATAR